MSIGKVAVVNRVWSRGGGGVELVEQSGAVSCQTLTPTGVRSCCENRMTLSGHLTGGRAESGARGTESVTFVPFWLTGV